MNALRVQLIGCDRQTEDLVRRRVARAGVQVLGSVPLHSAISAVAASDPDVAVLDAGTDNDVAADRITGLKDAHPDLPVIVLAEDVHTLAAGARGGVFDLVPKPLDLARLDIAIKNASQMRRLMRRVTQLQARSPLPSGFHGIVGESPVMREVVEAVENVARTDVGVVVTGEGGTGKSLVARAVHDAGERRANSFVALQCAAIPAELLESELFGHEPGAFDEADTPYAGCCERADGGTLFIEELCDLPLEAQGKLLQFARGGAFRRLGSAERREVDVRLIAATGSDPRAAVRDGRLREELFYRLNVVSIEVPPLRARRGDVALLAKHFLGGFATKYGRYFQGFEADALAALDRHSWPGNVRELENVIERIVVLHDGPSVTARMLPRDVLAGAPHTMDAESRPAPDEILPFAEIERREIVRALRICEGNVSRAAERLQIGQATLYRKVKKYGLRLRRGVQEAALRRR